MHQFRTTISHSSNGPHNYALLEPGSFPLFPIWSPPPATSIPLPNVWSSQRLFLAVSPWLRWSRPDTGVCTQSQVRHHRLQSESLNSTVTTHVMFRFTHVKERVARVLDECFTTVPSITTIMPPLVDLLSGSFAQFEPTCASTFILRCFPRPHRPCHRFQSFQIYGFSLQ